MPNLLALDCSTAACSVALLHGGSCIERQQLAAQQHSQVLLPLVAELLAEAGVTLSRLDALAFGCGPGSFTGLRIAVGVAQGLAFGADLPVVPVSSLAALAQTWADEAQPARDHTIVAALDARMQEVYWGIYRYQAAQALVRSQAEDRLSAPSAVALDAVEKGTPWTAVGSGWRSEYAAQMPATQAVSSALLPRAGALAKLGAAAWEAGGGVAPEQALPVYLRDNVAVKKADR